MKGKYLYGIIRKNGNHSLRLDGLTIVAYQGLAAVVAEKEIKDYHTLPKEETVKELIGHQQMIEKIMSGTSILPVRFGTILKDKKQVTSVLEKGYFLFRNTLRKIEDKIELDLVCFWNEEKAARMAYQKSKKVRSYATSEDKIALGKLIAHYLAGKREKLSNQILKTLKKETIESCGHALADVNMLLNQAFLVEKKREEAFNHALSIVNSKFADLLNFRLVGPLPPYSFATLLVDSLDEKEVENARGIFKFNGQFSEETLKQTYDALAMRLHPDKGGNPLEFEIVSSAYKLLKNFVQNGLVAVSLYKWEER